MSGNSSNRIIMELDDDGRRAYSIEKYRRTGVGWVDDNRELLANISAAIWQEHAPPPHRLMLSRLDVHLKYFLRQGYE